MSSPLVLIIATSSTVSFLCLGCVPVLVFRYIHVHLDTHCYASVLCLLPVITLVSSLWFYGVLFFLRLLRVKPKHTISTAPSRDSELAGITVPLGRRKSKRYNVYTRLLSPEVGWSSLCIANMIAWSVQTHKYSTLQPHSASPAWRRPVVCTSSTLVVLNVLTDITPIHSGTRMAKMPLREEPCDQTTP